MFDKLKPKKPAKRQIFNDNFFLDPANLIDEFSELKLEQDPASGGRMTGSELVDFMHQDKMRMFNEDCARITAKLPARPFVGVGSYARADGTYEPAWFVVGNIADVRKKVTDIWLRDLVMWDENGRLFVESYDYQQRVCDRDFTRGSLFEVRQLNERGLDLLKRTVGSDTPPVKKLFSKKYSDPPHISARVFAFPFVQWEKPDDVPLFSKRDTMTELARQARDVAFDLSGGFESRSKAVVSKPGK